MARRGADDRLRRDVEAVRDQMMDDFRRLDLAQQGARTLIESYAAHLPDRARTSGVLPRFRVLNGTADEVVREYLEVLDRHPLSERATPQELTADGNAYRHLGPRLGQHAAAMEQFVLDYDNEFRRVGEQVRRLDELVASATSKLQEATMAWQSLRDQSIESDEADRALAEARVAHRNAEAWQPGSRVELLNALVDRVLTRSTEVVEITASYPERIRRARTRGSTLRTKVATIETRRTGIAEGLGSLRREFGVGNWKDLDGAEKSVETALVEIRRLLGQLDGAVRAQRWSEALPVLEEVERKVDDADATVDSVRDRLISLRAFRDDPEAELGRARFALRDAQMLVTRGGGPHRVRWAAELDRQAFRLDGLRRPLEQPHPDYQHAREEIAGIGARVREVVDEVRAQRAR